MPSTYPNERVTETISKLKPKFFEVFKAKEEDVEWVLFTFAPGRLNIYGEHVDYMGGYACVGAPTEGCHILAGRVKQYANDGKIRFGTMEGKFFELDGLNNTEHNQEWYAFASAASSIILGELKKELTDPSVSGMCIISMGTLPLGSGMSSSASYGIALLMTIRAIVTGAYKKYPMKKDSKEYPELPRQSKEDLIKLSKQARAIETDYCGVNVGILDQFASSHATAGKFMVVDCETLEYTEYTTEPILGSDACYILINSMIRHELTADDGSGGYNEVVSDVEKAQEIVGKLKNGGKPFTFREFARDPKKFTDEDPIQCFKDCKKEMTPGQYNRGLYNISEQLRTLEFVSLLQPECSLSPEQRYKRAGELLNESYSGQRDLLKITTEELDLIHDTVCKDNDVAGARLMGGGFGGCVIVLLKKAAKDRVIDEARKAFKQKHNMTAEVYPAVLGDGAFVESLWTGEKA